MDLADEVHHDGPAEGGVPVPVTLGLIEAQRTTCADLRVRRCHRAVFADIDGVLAPWGRPTSVLDGECVARLQRLQQHALIVLTSSWPVEAAIEHGVPVDEALPYEARACSERDRLLGISRWLAEHPEIDTWVSIDDDSQREILERCPEIGLDPARVLRTTWRMVSPMAPEQGAEGDGLTERVYETALRLLLWPCESTLRRALETAFGSAAKSLPPMLAPDPPEGHRPPPRALTPSDWRQQVISIVRIVLASLGLESCPDINAICARCCGIRLEQGVVWVNVDGIVEAILRASSTWGAQARSLAR